MKIKKNKKYFVAFLLPTLFLPSLSLNVRNNEELVHPKNEEITSETELYKFVYKPKEVIYSNKSFNFDNNINIIQTSSLSELLENSINSMLLLKKINITKTQELELNKTNLLIAIKDDNDSYFKKIANEKNIDINKLTSNGYFIQIKEKNIYIYASDQRNLLYALNMMQEIFNQTTKSIKELKIVDFPDINNRILFDNTKTEIIKTNKIIEINSKNRFNKYIYFKSNDLKNQLKWRELYNDYELDDLMAIKNQTNRFLIDFIYTIDPFSYNTFNDGNFYESDLNVIKNKLLQLIEIGIYNFAFSSSIQKVDEALQTRVLNDIQIWLASQKNKINSINDELYYFGYELSDQTIPTYYSDFNEKIKIVMSGGKINNSLNNDFVDRFNEQLNKKINWFFNWNDINNKKSLALDLSGQILSFELNINNVDSVITPFSDLLYTSSYNLSQIGSFLWTKWSNQKEQQNNIKTIIASILDKPSVDSSLVLAFTDFIKHINNFNKPLDQGIDLKESEDFVQDLNLLNESIIRDDYSLEQIKTLKQKFLNLNRSLKLLMNNQYNSYINELLLRIEILSDITNSFIHLCDSLISLKINNSSKFISEILLSENYFNQVKIKTKNNEISVASKHFFPFLEKHIWKIKNRHADIFAHDIYEVNQTFISNRGLNSNPNEGVSIDNVFYRSNNKNAVFNGENNNIIPDDYVGVEFSKPINLKNIYIKMGNNNDHFYQSDLEYQLIGSDEWNKIGETFLRPQGTFEPIDVNDLNISNVIAVRLKNKETTNHRAWIRLFNFSINNFDFQEQETWYNDAYIDNNLNTQFETKDSAHVKESVLDDNPNTEWWLTSPSSPGYNENANFTLSYRSKKIITRVLVEQGTSKSSDVLNDFIIEYYDDQKNAWLQFGGHHLNNSQSQIISGYANTNKIRIVNKSTTNGWWRFATFKAGTNAPKTKSQYTIKSDNLKISSNLMVNESNKNNKLSYIVDSNNSTYALLSNKEDDGNIKQNNSIDIFFDDFKELSNIRILQLQNYNIKNFKIQKIYNNIYEDLSNEIYVGENLDYNFVVPSNNNRMNGVRIISTQNVENLWGLKSLDFEFYKNPTKENIITNIDNNIISNIKTREGNNIFSIFNSNETIRLLPNEYFGIDLKDIYYINEIKNNSNENQNISFFGSINGVEWIKISNIEHLNSKLKFRYIILKNTSNQEINYYFNEFNVKFREKLDFGKIHYTNFKLPKNYNKYLKLDFDTDLNTYAEYYDLKQDSEIIYDLTKHIELNSLKILIHENSYNFLRNAEILVSSNNYIWNPIFNVNENNSSNNLNKLRDTNYGFVDSNFPDFRYWGKNNLNLDNVRYIKIKIKNNYPQNRNLFINEIIVNNNLVLNETENDLKFISSDEKSILDKNIIEYTTDKDINTYFESSKLNGSIFINYNHNEINNKILKIITTNISNAIVKLRVYNTQTNVSQDIEIGKLLLNSNLFNLNNWNENQKIIGLLIEWLDIPPKINEILILNQTNVHQSNKQELSELIKNDPQDLEHWILNDKNEYNRLKKQAKEIINNEYINQKSIDDIKSEINYLISNKKIKEETSDLESIINNKINNENYFYTLSSYNFYTEKIEEAKTLLQEKENIDTYLLQESIKNINQAKQKLIEDDYQINVFLTNYNNFLLFDKADYNPQQINEINLLLEDTLNKINNKQIKIESIKQKNDEFIALFNKLDFSDLFNKKLEYEKLWKETNKLTEDNKTNWPSLIDKLEFLLKQNKINFDNANPTVDEINIINKFLIKAQNDFISNKNILINKFKDHLNDDLKDISDILINSSYQNYLKKLDKVKKFEITSEKNINDLKNEIAEAKKQIDFDQIKIENIINVIDNINIKNLINEEWKNIKEDFNDINFIKKIISLNDQTKNNDLIFLKEALVSSISNINKLRQQKEKLIEELNKINSKNELDNFIIKLNKTLNTYQKNETDHSKASETSEVKQNNKNKKQTPKDNIGIIFGSTFSALAIISVAGFLIYWFIFRKKKKGIKTKN